MAGLCEGGNEPPRILKASTSLPSLATAVAAMAVALVSSLAFAQSVFGSSRFFGQELPRVESEILSQLTDRVNFKKSLRRVRRRELPTEAINLEDLGEIPNCYKMTLASGKFLMRDENEDDRWAIIFATKRNLEPLIQSNVWFVDGTFKAKPRQKNGNSFLEADKLVSLVRMFLRKCTNEEVPPEFTLKKTYLSAIYRLCRNSSRSREEKIWISIDEITDAMRHQYRHRSYRSNAQCVQNISFDDGTDGESKWFHSGTVIYKCFDATLVRRNTAS
ncbi:hypothetical protein ANN_11142 [Periplaneta americana]|uniref:Uncharacterized protein n=1 Tax=Periplaneta americana TaxID=6978 RepID=A0ABQ8T5R2_PERAM|nr:hypothetical protein ANN_11142 [Periplaneta americana]